jgi:hypothetical protein
VRQLLFPEGPIMSIRLVFAAFILAAVLPAAAEECPSGYDERMALLEGAPTCEKSLALFESCSYTANGDVGLGEVVTRKCESEFLSKLGKSQRQAYARGQRHCASKYKNQSGTMYRSFEAFCSAILAKNYAKRFAKGANS